MASGDEQARLDALERKVEALEGRRDHRRYLAVGATGDPIREGVRNPPGVGTGATRETAIIGNHGGFTTRQSNINQGDGGSAIYGCRSTPANEPCINAVNLLAGRAFLFETAGSEGGRIEADGPNAKPFTTNAPGVATGLNADQVDGAGVCRTNGVLTRQDEQERVDVCSHGGLTIRADCNPRTGGGTEGVLDIASTSPFFVAGPAVDDAFATVPVALRSLSVLPASGRTVAGGDTGFYAGVPGDGTQLIGRVGILVSPENPAGDGDGFCRFVVDALG
jgi:hypothetical protein